MENQFMLIITILIICLLLFRNKTTEHMTDDIGSTLIDKISYSLDSIILFLR